MSFKTPILFLVFNRMDTTEKVFAKIREIKPIKLYLASDGARKNKENELKIVGEIRKYLLDNIDWQCEVKTLFRDENLGCKYAVSGAITWFFQNEEMGIILEDDCLPTLSFFQFCEECLWKYRYDERIAAISGTNLAIGSMKINSDSYFFSMYGGIWGWASWRRVWENYDIDMKNWPKVRDEGWLENVYPMKELKLRYEMYEKAFGGQIDTWDYQWFFTRIVQNQLSVVPNENLVSNIGFDKFATHTFDENSPHSRLPTIEIKFPLKHPSFIIINKWADDYIREKVVLPPKKINRVINKMKSLIYFVKGKKY